MLLFKSRQTSNIFRAFAKLGKDTHAFSSGIVDEQFMADIVNANGQHVVNLMLACAFVVS